jgi:glycosyltransferase involved in cell wall biosynthesis
MKMRRRIDTSGCRRVAVDATCWLNSRGYGRHARDLLSALMRIDNQNRYSFFVDSHDMLERLPAGVDPVLVSAGSPTALAASSDGSRSLPDIWRMSRALSHPGFDLVLFPTVYSYVPVLSRAHKMVFIHDVIAEKYPELTLPSLPSRFLWKSKVGLALRQAGTIVTVSNHSKQGIIEVFKVAPNSVHVVGEAPNPIFRRQGKPEPLAQLAGQLQAGGRQVVYIGGFGPHKNLSRLVEVFARLAASPDLADISLILVGEYQKEVFHSAYTELRNKIEALGIQQRVVFTGYLSDPDLVSLLNQACLLVLPSLLEGFGLPAVEAAACGCPVVATKASPLPELLGAGGIYFDPLNSQELEEALRRVLESLALQQKMGAAGMEAAQALTWDRAARTLKNLIDTVDPR